MLTTGEKVLQIALSNSELAEALTKNVDALYDQYITWCFTNAKEASEIIDSPELSLLAVGVAKSLDDPRVSALDGACCLMMVGYYLGVIGWRPTLTPLDLVFGQEEIGLSQEPGSEQESD